MDFAFSPEEEAFREEVATFLEKEVPPEYREKRLTFFDMSAQQDWIKVHRYMAEKLGEKGWLSMHWPKENGGQGVSPFYRLILREELSRYHSPGYDSIGVGIVAPAILLKGSDEQKKQHLPGIASGKVMWCETLSEPNHGSDLAAIEVFARKKPTVSSSTGSWSGSPTCSCSFARDSRSSSISFFLSSARRR